MRSIFILTVALLFSTSSFAQPLPSSIYAASGIADSMKNKVDGVYRLDEEILQIRSRSHYTFKEHAIFTILNESGVAHLTITEGIDKFHSISDIEVKIYNADGIEVKRYKKKDFKVQLAYDGETLVSDSKVMYLQTAAPGYPCTIETILTRDVTGYISLPPFNVSNIDHSVESFKFQVEVPVALDIRHRARNLNIEPVINTVGENKTYTWQGRNHVGKNIPANGFQNSKYASQIDIAPNAFEYDGHPGTFKDWKTFGEWSIPFYIEKNPFTPDRVAEIKQLVVSCKTDAEKIRVLYDHMKRNMRYVSIQLGIGGFKPFPASFVDTKKYGDCKALTNYMHHLLNVVGIQSFPALINASYSSPPVDLSFPINKFNHVILCVPQKNDSIWLECTSNFASAGFLGSFTENKKALLITPNGGVLVSTPKSNAANNRLVSKTEIEISADGSALAKRLIYCSGDEQDEFEYIRQMNMDDTKSALVRHLNYRAPDDYRLTFKGDTLNGYGFGFEGAYSQLYDFKAGSKMFFPQTVSKLSDDQLKIDTSRTIEYLFDHPYERIDTTVFLLPETMTLETMPPAKEVKSDLASYRFETNYDEATNRLQIISHLILRENQIPPNHYKGLANFFIAVNRNQGQKVVIKMKQ
jgi:hypothetical protein